MNRKNEDRAADGGSARYGHPGPGTGSNEPKHAEKKEQRADWIHQQGGDQSRDDPPREDADGGSTDGRRDDRTG